MTTVQTLTPQSFQSFGDLLKYLRRRERLTQLELSIAVGYSEAQISRLEQNQRLPDLAALKALFIPALHLEEEPELAARLLELAQSARQEDAPAPGIAPYKGLLFFDEPDADLFFGREELTAHLAERVMDLATDSSSRFLAVVGASGSGKSSLVRAGLAVALKNAGWAVRVFTPTANPLKMLDLQFNPHHSKAKSGKLLLLVDQFEETFTLCRDESERSAFIERLLKIAGEPQGQAAVVIALRADFYSHCAQYPLLRQAVASQQEYIGQMTVEELKRAIEEPARRNGWEFEHGLVDVLLQDIGLHGANEPEPGALPLLSHALLATWERRRGRTFTLEGYHASGGVRGAIAETAESVFTDRLDQSQQELARDIFLRLTELGEGTQDTRRRAALIELERQSLQAAQLRAVLNVLADARLITLNEDSAEVAHEALIREWQRLHEWLTQDREGLRLHRHLTDSAHEWERRGRDASELYRGARLAQAREWAGTHENHLNESERAFLKASIEQEQRDTLEREAQRQRELDVAKKLAETESQHSKQLRRRAVFLAGAFVLAVILAGVAILFGSQANTNAQAARAEQQVAFERELSASAINNLSVDPERSILLSLQAVNIGLKNNQPVLIEAQDALHRSIQSSRVLATLHEPDVTIWSVTLSRDGKRLAAIGDDGMVRVWDLATDQVMLTLKADTGMGGGGHGLAFSPDGHQLLTVTGQKSATLWDLSTGRALFTLEGHSDHISTLDFSSDGKILATGSDDGTGKLWNASTGRELATLTDQNDPALYVAFSPDGSRLYAGSDGNTLAAWEVATGKELFTFKEPGGGTDVTAIAASPDGRRVATGDFDTSVKIWDAGSGNLLLKLFGHASYVNGLAFSPDGKTLATASEDGTVRLWDALTGKALLILSGHASGVLSVAFSPDGQRLYTSSRDGTVKIWDISASAGSDALNLVGSTDRLASVAYRPDGKQVATLGWDGTVRIWDALTGRQISLIKLAGVYGIGNALAGHLTYSPDGKRLAYNDLNTTRIIDSANGAELLALDPLNGGAIDVTFAPDGSRIADAGVDGTIRVHAAASGKILDQFALPSSSGGVQQMVFSPDGHQIAVAAGDGAYVYDASSGKLILKYNGHGAGVRNSGIAYSPDGKWIASSGNDSTIKVWDAHTGADVFTLTGHTGPTFGVVFSSDGRQLVTSSVDRTVKVWTLPARPGDPITDPLTLYGNSGAVYQVAISPDNTRIVSAGRDLVIHIYELNIEKLIKIAEARLTRGLTTEECRKYLHMDTCPASP